MNYCIEKNILADFLLKNRMEAIEMCIFEFDEEKFLKSEREWSYNNGREAGREETLIKNVETLMKNLDIDLHKALKMLDISEAEYQSAKERILENL